MLLQDPTTCLGRSLKLNFWREQTKHGKRLDIKDSAICDDHPQIDKSLGNHPALAGNSHKIDPILGSNEDFRHLVDTAKAKGIRIILDGVFSHTGSNSRYFNREGQYNTIGAFQSPDSPYYEWYNFRNFPYGYESWWNFSTLPDVKETTPSYMDFIIYDKDSVMHHWMKEGIAGWRLDVIDELPAAFSQAFFAELKKTDPDAVMIGEVWEDASHKVAYGVPREYLCGQEMDSAMNYPFRQILFDFLLGRTDARMSLRRFESLRENYPRENFYAMMNLIGSHDVERAITVLGEEPFYDGMPAIEQSRARLSDDQYNLGMARLFMAALWQMTYPGVPCVYYGDEIAMQGFKDPYNRRPYDWEHGDTYVRSRYERMIRMRNEHTALQTGELLPLYAEGDVMGFARLVRGGRDVAGRETECFISLSLEPQEEENTVAAQGWRSSRTVTSTFHPGRRFLRSKRPAAVTFCAARGFLRRTSRLGTATSTRPASLFRRRRRQKYGVGVTSAEAYLTSTSSQGGLAIAPIPAGLPLGPVGFSYSPYQSPSAFAGNPLLIDIDELIEKGWLSKQEAKVTYADFDSSADFEPARTFKNKCLRKAHAAFQRDAEAQADYEAFCRKEAYWLDDYALFEAAKRDFDNKGWMDWPENIKKREPAALASLKKRLAEDIALQKFMQYLFHRQWQRLHDYAKEKEIRIMGDMPIFLAQDSADVWANQQLFDLNPDGTAHTVAGVPPDYFSATGQLWGNPQYDWQAMKAENYAWWKKRFQKLYEMVDLVRIDHFRGFESYWEVDGKAKNAIKGRWLPGPGKPFFDEVRRTLGKLPIVAEDLGIITPEVEKLRDDCGFPGMKVLEFTLYLNHQHRLSTVVPENSIVYTGTHDNNTLVGWLKDEVTPSLRKAIADLVRADVRKPEEIASHLVGFAYASNARLAVVPMQDLLQLDGSARMNTPGTSEGNWRWCMRPGDLEKVDAAKLRELAVRTGRA